MPQTMPSIEVIFLQKAVTAIQRSERGVVCVVVNDDTAGDAVKEYSFSSEVKSEEYKQENYKAIMAAFTGLPNKVVVVKLGADATFTDAAEPLKGVDYNWLCYLNAESGEQDKVAQYVKEINAKNKQKKRKCVVYQAITTDDMHVVNFTNEAITFKEETAAYPVAFFVARLCGMLAGLPFTRSATYSTFSELLKVAEPEDLDEAVGNGEFILFNDGGEVKAGTAVNSLTTIGENVTEDMQKITIVEAMDLIQEDVTKTFAEYYCGKYKNTYDNQVLFLSAVNSYFRQLAKESVLDPNYNNTSGIDVEAQREQWLSTGTTEAADWNEQKVKAMTYRNNVNLAGNVKILDAMEDLTFHITMA